MDNSEIVLVEIPKIGVNDDTVIIAELSSTGEYVDKDDVIAVLETTKTAFELDASCDGYFYINDKYDVGDKISTGFLIGLISKRELSPEELVCVFEDNVHKDVPTDITNEHRFSAKALQLIKDNNLDKDEFPKDQMIRKSDVLEFLNKDNGDNSDVDIPDNEINQYLEVLRNNMREVHNRHVPLGTLLNDRWKLAESVGAGKATSIYDENLIIGDVSIGKNSWIGPFGVLDGSGGKLRIGDYCSIATGVQLYTHNTIGWALTGGKGDKYTAATTIGDCCFIAPNVVVSAGTQIGSHSFVAAGSYVEGVFPPYSFIQGNPAVVSGKVKISGGKFSIVRNQD